MCTNILKTNWIGRFLLKGTHFVCDTCHTVTKATIDDYIFSVFFPASLSENVTYLFSEEALLLGYHISHKCPGSSKNMYARTLEDVSKEYGRVHNTKQCNLFKCYNNVLVDLEEWTD
jgi:hypothetical protein